MALHGTATPENTKRRGKRKTKEKTAQTGNYTMVAVTFTAYNTQSKHRAEYRPRPSAHGLFEAPSPSSPKRAGGVMSLSGHVLRLWNVVGNKSATIYRGAI